LTGQLLLTAAEEISCVGDIALRVQILFGRDGKLFRPRPNNGESCLTEELQPREAAAVQKES